MILSMHSQRSVMVVFHTIFVLFVLANGIQSKSTPVVQTTKGLVEGEILKTVISSLEYSSFKGIPYGEPPVGYLRFKPPVPRKPWNGIYKSVREGPSCVQKDVISEKYIGSEDCLYLNVYTPKLEFQNAKTDLLPVMVWIYGGSFKNGNGDSDMQGPDFIIEENVILVTFNYRLGPLGFLNLNHENATGNAALKDQNLVLRWVKENIDKFGGHPNEITLFGESAGGVSADFHGLSDMSRGLFQRSISMSSSPLCPWAFDNPEIALEQAFVLSYKLGKTTSNPEDALEVLYKTPAIEIMKKSEEMGMHSPIFKPTIEKTDIATKEEKFLTTCSYWQYLSGNFYKIPHMTGFTSNEALLWSKAIEPILDMIKLVSNVIKTFPKSYPILSPIINNITSKLSQGIDTLSETVIDELFEQISDVIFVTGIDMKRNMIHKHSGYPVYYYRFSYETYESLHRSIYKVNWNGTAHGDDIAYLFHMTVANISLAKNDPTFTTRKRMVRMWTNFAKYANPTPRGSKDKLLQGITWPDSGSSKKYLEFGKNLKIQTNPTDLTVSLLEKINDIILPIQTGCTSEIINIITENPIDSLKMVKDKAINISKPIISKLTSLT